MDGFKTAKPYTTAELEKYPFRTYFVGTTNLNGARRHMFNNNIATVDNGRVRRERTVGGREVLRGEYRKSSAKRFRDNSRELEEYSELFTYKYIIDYIVEIIGS